MATSTYRRVTTTGRRRSRVGASRHPGTGAPCRARVRPTSRYPADGLYDGQLPGQERSRSLRRRERRPSYTHTAAPVLGPRAATPGVAANSGPSVDVSSTASYAAPTGRVPGLRGAFIIASTPCSCVGVGDQHSGIVVLLKSSRQCSLYYLLTYGQRTPKLRSYLSSYTHDTLSRSHVHS